MVIHIHAFVLGGGDGVRAKNICKDISEKISSRIIELEFFALSDWRKSNAAAGLLLSKAVVRKYRIPQIPFGGRSAFFDFLNSFWKSIVVLFFFLLYKPKAIIGEYSTASDNFLFAKLLKRKSKLIVDMHGSVPEEAEYANPNVSKKYLSRLEKKENDSCRVADYIVCQSTQMKNHIINKYKATPSIIYVYNCAVDSDVFYYDSDARDKIRKQLDIPNDAVVFVYSGGISPWQRIHDTLSIFERYHEYNKKSYFIVLSKEQAYFSNLLRQYPLIRKNTFIFSLDFKEVHRYLSAADVGFLLRDDVVLNRVASPTKLAEYLSCGMIVVVGKVANNWVDGEGKQFFLYEDEMNKWDPKIVNISKTAICSYAKEKMSLEKDRKVIRELVNRLLS